MNAGLCKQTMANQISSTILNEVVINQISSCTAVTDKFGLLKLFKTKTINFFGKIFGVLRLDGCTFKIETECLILRFKLFTRRPDSDNLVPA